jgi:hypothetical protein
MRLTNHKKKHRDRRSNSKVIDENVARKNRLQLFARYCKISVKDANQAQFLSLSIQFILNFTSLKNRVKVFEGT